MDSPSGFLAGNSSGGKIYCYANVYCFQTKISGGECVRPQKWSQRKSDPHDVTDWSTDYMLCKTYCVTVLRTVLIKYKYLWRIVLNVCTSLTLQQFINQQVYNPRDIHTPFSLLTRLQYSHLQIHCLNSWKVAMLCWHVECKLQLLFYKRLLTRYLPLNCYGSSYSCKISV